MAHPKAGDNVSVRAHPFKLDFKNLCATFNLWHDENILNALISVGNYYSEENGNIGLVNIDEYSFEQMKEYWKEQKTVLTEDEKEALKEIEENIKNETYDYICY